MSHHQTEPSFRLEFSEEDRQSYRSFLRRLYYAEGNITFPLWAFDTEVKLNYSLLREHYSSLSDILDQDEARNIEIRLDAANESIDSLEVDGTVLFGVPAVLYHNRNIVSDDMLRKSLNGEKKERCRKEFYQSLCLVKHLLQDVFNELERHDLGTLEYRLSSEMDLDESLHRIMAPEPASSLMSIGWRGRSHEGGKDTYHVFISHAGEDKQTMAIPLQQRLSSRGVQSFLDVEELRPGDLAASSMRHAMQTAQLGVIILSPEFAAKRWPMLELECFLRRKVGKGAPAEVLPVFYRLREEECVKPERLFSMESEAGENLFEALGFFDRVARGETSTERVGLTLEGIAMVPGIENAEEAGNESCEEMSRRRERLLDRIADRVLQALEDI